ncbi:MAG: cupin domain-containing protein [Gammaproteobacteria bacterium]
MNNKSIIVNAEDGQSFWQPGVQGNCITIKVSPWNIPTTGHTVFLHELPQGGEVPEHSHETNEEIFICLDGEGTMTIDGKEIPFKKHDVAYLAPLSSHHIKAISKTPLKFMVIITPTGLEERLKLMGIPKKDLNEAAPASFDSTIGKQSTHGVNRAQ